jgi:uncharacterized membrane protein YdjX (TVP38/TMEM64 family)
VKISRRYWFWIGIGVAAAAAAAVAVLAPVREWEGALEASLERMGLVQGLLVFCAIYVVGSLLLVPAWIFGVAAGAVFGMGWGLVGAIVSSTLAALAAFVIARYVLRDRVERAAKRNETFTAVDKAVRREPWKVVALLRMSPVMPSGLKSYFLGLTCVKTLDYASATAAGMLPGLALKVYLGHAGRDLLADGGAAKWAMLGAGVAATVIMATVVSRFARKRLSL